VRDEWSRRSVFSLQSVTERFRRLPCLFIADMGIAHGRADILVAEQFLDFPQILSHLVEQDRGCGVAQSVRGDLPHPEGDREKSGAERAAAGDTGPSFCQMHPPNFTRKERDMQCEGGVAPVFPGLG
jgi:hypothetical protein